MLHAKKKFNPRRLDLTIISAKHYNITKNTTLEHYNIVTEHYTIATENYIIATESYPIATENYAITTEHCTIITKYYTAWFRIGKIYEFH